MSTTIETLSHERGEFEDKNFGDHHDRIRALVDDIDDIVCVAAVVIRKTAKPEEFTSQSLFIGRSDMIDRAVDLMFNQYSNMKANPQ